ncbi:MAG: RagB/SusD family nutrient uptake outer membrane protein [Parabacteroides sp.]
MKTYRLLYAFVGMLLFVSCLDEHPKSQLTEEEAFGSVNNLYLNTVATLYNYMGSTQESEGLQGTYRGVYDYNTFTTDEAMLPTRGADWFDGGFWQSLYLHRWTSSDPSLNNTWNYLYKVVTLCNRSLALIESYQSMLSISERQSFLAEVRAIRALFYYYLLDMFGNVPLCLSADDSVNEIHQTSRSDVYRFVVRELEETAPLLENQMSQLEGSFYGRMTRPVAYFLLAKLALNAEVYADDDWTDGQRPDGKTIYFTVGDRQLNAWEATLAYCQMIEEAGYHLEEDYAANFAVNNENSMENIFVIPMDKTIYQNWFKNLFRSRHYNHGAVLGMDAENGTCATRSTVLTFGYGTEEVDTRYWLNFYSDDVWVDREIVYLDNGEPLIYEPLEVRLDLTGSPYEKTAGARMSKYEIDRTAYSDGWLQNNDIVLFRFADVLLMKAEAKVRNGQSGDEELNQIRARVEMPVRKATLDTLLDERLMELMWEGWRRQDLIRFGRFTSAYDERTPLPGEETGYTIVFPIPDNARALNTNLYQNPGYSGD